MIIIRPQTTYLQLKHTYDTNINTRFLSITKDTQNTVRDGTTPGGALSVYAGRLGFKGVILQGYIGTVRSRGSEEYFG